MQLSSGGGEIDGVLIVGGDEGLHLPREEAVLGVGSDFDSRDFTPFWKVGDSHTLSA